MFLKEKKDIFSIILGLYIMDFGIGNDITDQRHVRVVYSLPNAHDSTRLHDWNKPQRFPQQTFWLFSGFEEASESFLCVSMGSDEQEIPLSRDSLALVWRDFQCTDHMFQMGIQTCSHFHFISACFHTASISNFQFNYRVNQWNHVL